MASLNIPIQSWRNVNSGFDKCDLYGKRAWCEVLLQKKNLTKILVTEKICYYQIFPTSHFHFYLHHSTTYLSFMHVTLPTSICLLTCNEVEILKTVSPPFLYEGEISQWEFIHFLCYTYIVSRISAKSRVKPCVIFNNRDV